MKEKGWGGQEERQTYELSGRGRVLDKGTEGAVPALAGLLNSIPKGDHVEHEVDLLELLREADERALRVWRVVVERRADKDDPTLPQVFVPVVLERELRDRCRDRCRAAEVGRA